MLLRCQYLYFCSSKASKLRMEHVRQAAPGAYELRRCQNLYFCTSKASKLSTCVAGEDVLSFNVVRDCDAARSVSICTCAPVKQVN